KNINRKRVGKQVLDEVVGLGAIQDLLADDSISEVMVNSPDEIFYEKNGKLLKSVVTYTDANAVMSTIERIVAPLGRRIDESSPMVDARLKDGSRVNAIIPPLALKGPCITIRKFMKNRLAAQDLVRFGSMSPAMSEFLE
ncbi:MAG: ATPase, T2SS/T4P/T4SS family, partial [Flammeovirgaceae bacterium]